MAGPSCGYRFRSRGTARFAVAAVKCSAISLTKETWVAFSIKSDVITDRAPDSLRGADVAFYSFARVPKGPLPDRHLDIPPDLIVEVLSPTDRWPKVLAKVAEYLEAGTSAVVVLDDERRQAHLYRADGATQVLDADAELTIPDLLGDFRVRVGRFFE